MRAWSIYNKDGASQEGDINFGLSRRIGQEAEHGSWWLITRLVAISMCLCAWRAEVHMEGRSAYGGQECILYLTYSIAGR
jgi:hypothetical protein